MARRSVRMVSILAGVTIAFVLLLGGVLATRLAMGPIAIEGLSRRVAAAMNQQIGAEWRASIETASIDHAGLNPALTLKGVEIYAPDGQRLLRAPEATVAVDPWSLVWGRFRPRAIDFRGLSLRLAMTPDGQVAFSAGPEAAAPGDPHDHAITLPSADRTPEQLSDVLARGAAAAIGLLTQGDGFLSDIDTASITGARVTLIGADGSPRFSFRNADLSFTRPKDNLRQFSFALTGGKGRWRLDGTIAGRSAEKRIANLTFRDVPVSDLQAFSQKQPQIWTDMPLSGTVTGAIGSDGSLSDLSARVQGASSVIHTDDPDMPRFIMDSAEIEAVWRPEGRKFDITRLFASWDGYHVVASGALERGENGAPWRLRLDSSDALAIPYGPGDAPTPVKSIIARVSGAPDGGARIEQFDVDTSRGKVSVSGQVGGPAVGDGVALTISGEEADARAALALWPTFAARPVRDYMGRTFAAGRVDRFNVRVRMTRADILAARQKKPMRGDELAVDVAMSDIIWRATPATPPVRGAARAVGTGAQARITLDDARMTPPSGPELRISSGEVLVHSALRPTPRADIGFDVAGDLPAMMRVMASAGLGELPIAPDKLSGSARLRVALDVPLKAGVDAAAIRPKISGSLSEVAINHVIGEHRFEAGAFTVNVNHELSALKGEGRIAGVPVAIDLRQPLNAPGGDLRVSAALDDAMRNSLGIKSGTGLSGPVVVNVNLSLPASGDGDRAPRASDNLAPRETTPSQSGILPANASHRIEVDLSRAQISNLLPGWSKAAGKPGRLTFILDGQGGGYRLSDLTLDAGNVSASKGAVELDPKGALQRLRLGTFRMSPADNMRVEVERADDVYKIAVRGQLIDARPMIRALVTDDSGGQAGGAAKTGNAASAQKIDLDLSAAILAGFNSEAMTNASLKLSMRNGRLAQASMDGRFGKDTATLRLSPQRSGGENLVITASNGGALLRFADLYRRMYGGDLVISAFLKRGSQSGSIDIARFVLRDEPALGRIVAAQPARDTRRINVSEVPFQRLQGQFSRKAGQVQLRDGIIWGPQIGIKLDGTVDFGRDRTELVGTYIPAYALNNAFARIPLVGPLIGGGSNEGMFAVSFRITGPASAPTLTVNPLTAVAPGIFRKFLEVFTPDGAPGQPAPAP